MLPIEHVEPGAAIGLEPRAVGVDTTPAALLLDTGHLTPILRASAKLSERSYYDDRKPPAKRRARIFLKERLPKYLGWLEKVLQRNRRSRGQWLVGSDRTYVDLSAFQVVEGLRYAFPNAMARLEPGLPSLTALRDRVVARPRIAAYMASERRQAFNEMGIFRHYPELDAPPLRRGRKPARS